MTQNCNMQKYEPNLLVGFNSSYFACVQWGSGKIFVFFNKKKQKIFVCERIIWRSEGEVDCPKEFFLAAIKIEQKSVQIKTWWCVYVNVNPNLSNYIHRSI